MLRFAVSGCFSAELRLLKFLAEGRDCVTRLEFITLNY
jgi:hypothetical protein